MFPVLHERERGGLTIVFFVWMISENIKYEAPKETTFIDNVHVTRIYKFYPFCRDLRILLRDFRGVGPNYYDITFPIFTILHGGGVSAQFITILHR